MKSEARAQAQEQRASSSSTENKVSAFDPDFILVFMLAVGLDFLDIILLILDIFFGVVIPEIISHILDGIAFAIIGGWTYWRIKKITKSKQQQIQGIKQQMGRMARQEIKQTGKSASRGARRGFLSFIAEWIPLIGALPIWTFCVVMVLRERGD